MVAYNQVCLAISSSISWVPRRPHRIQMLVFLDLITSHWLGKHSRTKKEIRRLLLIMIIVQHAISAKLSSADLRLAQHAVVKILSIATLESYSQDFVPARIVRALTNSLLASRVIELIILVMTSMIK